MATGPLTIRIFHEFPRRQQKGQGGTCGTLLGPLKPMLEALVVAPQCHGSTLVWAWWRTRNQRFGEEGRRI